MSLRDFLKISEKEGDVFHVKEEVSPRFEVSFILKNFDTVGPILLFERIKDSENKIVANVCGTRKRLCKALEVDQGDFCQKLIGAWHSPRKAKIIENDILKKTKTVNLSSIPVLTHFEKDAAPYITSAVVHARAAKEQIENVSVHRLEVLDKNHLAIRLVPRHLFRLWRMAKENGRDLDVAISIGVHPAILLAASSPLPFGVCEFDVANSLLRGKLRLIECADIDACAPANSELVLEGKISRTEEILEGPFVDITGTYDVQRKQPVVTVVGVLQRENYVYQGLLPAGSEHKLLMGIPHEALIFEAVSKVVPKVHSVNLTSGGCGWLHAVISVEKQLDGDAKNVILAAFAAHPSLKHVVVVDPDIDVFDPYSVEWAIATRFQASEDLVVINNARGSTLDSSANQETGLTTKVGVDATRPLGKPKEKFEKARIVAGKETKTLLEGLRGV